MVTNSDNGWHRGVRRCKELRGNAQIEDDKARSMSGFKEPGFADRQKAAAQAKQNLLNKFRAQPGHDDP